jgi:hypothetical protein
VQLWVSPNCESTGHCVYGGHEWAACTFWTEGKTSMWAGLGDVGGRWSYIDPSDHYQGVQWTMAPGVDLYDGCTANQTRSVISYVCTDYPGDNHVDVMQVGTAPACEWLFRVNSVEVCKLAPPAAGKIIVPGANWTDTAGSSIQAHAPGILLVRYQT